MSPSDESLNVALVGEESAAVRTLGLVEELGHRIACVLTSRASSGAASVLWERAERAGFRTWPAERVEEPALADELRRDQVDLLLNVHSLHVVAAEVLQAPRLGSFNLHPGPLPRYAGLDTVSWAIYEGATEYGVTLHEMVPRIDAGRIAFQESFPIGDDDTAFTVYARCVREGLPLVERLLRRLASGGGLPLEPQDLTKRRYYSRRPPQGGRVRWDRTAREVWRFVRACDYGPFESPWGRPATALGDREVELLAVTPTGAKAEELPGTVRRKPSGRSLVACADEWLEVGAARLDGERRRPAEILPDGVRLS